MRRWLLLYRIRWHQRQIEWLENQSRGIDWMISQHCESIDRHRASIINQEDLREWKQLPSQ